MLTVRLPKTVFCRDGHPRLRNRPRRAQFLVSVAIASTLVLALAPFALGAPAGAAAEVRLHVHGTTIVEAHAARASGRVAISGTVTDDAGRPRAGERVTLRVSRGGPAGGFVGLSAARPQACALRPGGSSTGSPPEPPSLVDAEKIGMKADSQGRFCAEVALDPDLYEVHVAAPAADDVEGAAIDFALDVRSSATALVDLAFDPPRPVLSLDETSTEIDVVASIEEDGVTRGAEGLRIVVANEAGQTVGDATTRPSGHALVVADASHLGPIGPGKLRASFAGNATTSPAACSIAVDRRAHVDLSIAGAEASGNVAALEPGNPADGVSLGVKASPRCAPGCSGVPTGAIEARVGDAVVGAATLDQGRASLLVTFDPPGESEVALRLRFLPDAPSFLPGEELVAHLPVRSASPWKRTAVSLAGLAIAAWLVLDRGRPWRRLGRRGAAADRKEGQEPIARVEVVAPLASGRGWTGTVLDAHDAVVVAGARVAIERRGFERVQAVAEARAGDDGRFALPAVDLVPGDEIVVEASLHAQLRDAAPRSGDLRIALVMRRRALLDRLVGWARKRGKPFDARPDPTPGHVRRAAGSDSPVGRWADAVEKAAFGGDVVDGPAQAKVDALLPAPPADAAGGDRADAAARESVPPPSLRPRAR
jgi:hypothetical protein